MKKTVIIICGLVLVLFVAFMVTLGVYNNNLKAVSNETEEVVFSIKPGTSTSNVINDLYSANLIKSDKALMIYVKLHGGINLKAGSYKLNRSMSAKEIIEKINNGDSFEETVTITLIEGRRLVSYASKIAEAFDLDKDEVIAYLDNKDNVKKYIDKYWFLTDEVLNDSIYHPLEGYLYPDTYIFKKDASLDDIITKILDNTNKKLESFKDKVTNGNYTMHEILSMAAITELEANSAEDRASVAQVIYKRLELNMSLGMDVTTYYAVNKEMGETLYQVDLDKANPYNTRSASTIGKLPVGPICNPSIISINATFNPSNTDYVYFYADINTGKVYFAKTYNEFLQIIGNVG